MNDAYELLEIIFDNTGLVADLKILETNPAFQKLVGIETVDFIGKTKKQVFPNTDQYWFECVNQALKEGKPVRCENYRSYSGRLFESQFIPISKNQVAVLYRDITERKKAEETLLKKQQELNLILDSSPTIVFYKDKDGKIVQANRAFAEALKLPKEDLLGKTVYDLYPAEIAQGMTNDDLEVFKTKQPKLGIVEPYQSPTGLRWICTHKIPTINEEGAVTGLVGFSEEITERKKTEQELLEAKSKTEQDIKRLEAIVETVPSAVVIFDSNGKISGINKHAMELYGFDNRGLSLPESVNRIFPRKLNGRPLRFEDLPATKALKGEIVRNEELIIQKPDGTTFPILVSAAPILSVEGKVLSAIVIFEDISQRKYLEKMLADQQRLAAIGATAGMIGHDIRNPLQAIMSDAYLLKAELAELPECKALEGVNESIENMERNIGYINKIVADLQDYSRTLNPECISLNLHDLIVDIFIPIDLPKEIMLSIDITSSLQLKTDPTLMQRILTNLIINAMQAMPNGGNLTISAHHQANKASIIVEDTGVGIPEDVKPKLFTPMMTTKSKGQGLGLAVVKRLVEALNGTISFESEVGKGTKFKIELPLKN